MISCTKLLLLVLCAAAAALFLLLTVAVLRKKMHFWIVSELLRCARQLITGHQWGYTHVMFAFVDHFEPGNNGADTERQELQVDQWCNKFPLLAGRHKDSDGIAPQHTFFLPPHRGRGEHLKKIVELCSIGFGEVEMHLHHERQEPWPDDAFSLRKKITDCIEDFSRYNIFCLPGGQRRYAFIHGDWALANSREKGEHCGVNDEIKILLETGCYADFTFPVCNEAQPKRANTLLYGLSSPEYPKGYNKRNSLVTRGKRSAKGLMLIQGIIGLRWKSRTHLFWPSIEQSNIGEMDDPTPRRIDYWINKRIHVQGKQNWIFVKVHTHGANEDNWKALFGEPADEMYTYLENKYNDQRDFFLHYVSAREMYNIIRAAQDGKEGNPNDYRDYEIPRYIYLPRR